MRKANPIKISIVGDYWATSVMASLGKGKMLFLLNVKENISTTNISESYTLFDPWRNDLEMTHKPTSYGY